MELGKHLRELFRYRTAATVCTLLGVFAAVWASYEVRLSPLGLSTRPIQIASASTEVLVDTPFSAAVPRNAAAHNDGSKVCLACMLVSP